MRARGVRQAIGPLKDAKWAFFDIGNTLVDETEAVLERIRRICQAARGLGYHVLDPSGLYERLLRAFGEFQERVFVAAFEASGVRKDDSIRLVDEHRYSPALETPFPSATAVLKKCAAGMHLGYIANQEPGLEDRLRKYGLGRYLETGVDSGSSRFHKPQTEIFEEALRRADCRPADAVMIGDRIDNDIVPAKKLGLKTIWVRQGYSRLQLPRTASETADLTVESLEELLQMLG